MDNHYDGKYTRRSSRLELRRGEISMQTSALKVKTPQLKHVDTRKNVGVTYAHNIRLTDLAKEGK